jgi:hypothetical protein
MNGAGALPTSGARTSDVRGARTSVAPSAGGRTSDDRGARGWATPAAGARTSDDRGAAQAGLDVRPRHGGRPVSGARARVATLGPFAPP